MGLSPDELAALKESRDRSDERDGDREEAVADGRDARESQDANVKAALFVGEGIFLDIGSGDSKKSTTAEAEPLAAQGGAAATAGERLANKAIDVDLRKTIVKDSDDVYYVSASSREVCMRSMEKQGIEISRKDLTIVQGTRGARTRFNAFDDKHPRHYASGSHKVDGGGPRIQGPNGGPGSCKFIIVQR